MTEAYNGINNVCMHYFLKHAIWCAYFIICMLIDDYTAASDAVCCFQVDLHCGSFSTLLSLSECHFLSC